MSEFPSTSPQASFPPAESPAERLQQGLTALRTKTYDHAIHCLSTLTQDEAASSTLRLKAQIGLVQAYQGQGQTAAAIALCQPLIHHPQAKVRAWAQTTLTRLQQSPSTPTRPATASDLSGFQPLTTPPPVMPASEPPAQETTGAPGRDRPGWQPIQPSPAVWSVASPGVSPTPAPATTAEPAVPEIAQEAAAAAAAPPPPPVTNQPEAPGPATSAFHFEHLNQTAQPTAPEADTDPPLPLEPPPVEPEGLSLHYAGRLERLRPLPPQPALQYRTWGVMALTAIALFGVSRTLVQGICIQLAQLLYPFRTLVPFPLGWFYQPHTVLVLVGLLGLLLASPWLLDSLLQRTDGLRPLPLQRLKQTHPEGCRLLRRLGQQRNWLLPTLQELPTDTPMVFSYGWLPRFSRIVISRGALNQLTDDELATLIGYELTHMTTWTLPFMSLVAVLLQLLYQGYWQAAQWGDRQAAKPLKAIAAVGAAGCYGLYWLFRQLSVPLSQTRVPGGDRQAVDWTGNPNGLIRALIKLETGIADSIQQAGKTPPLLESTDLLTPCGVAGAIDHGSLFPQPAFLDRLRWHIQNPYRRWLALSSSHPLLGERLKTLTTTASHWQLPPELPAFAALALPQRQRPAPFWNYWQPFLQQTSPYLGLLLGGVIALTLWFLGGLVRPLGIAWLGWVYGDRTVLWASLFLGFGMGLMLRINPFFPDIVPARRRDQPSLGDLVQDPMALPTNSQPVRLQGTLLGRAGIANWLCQDFILKTPSGLVKLHFLSLLGAFGNLFIHPQHPSDWLGRAIEVQGWFRTGAIAWLDIDQILQSRRVITRAHHPVWSGVLSLASCLAGLVLLLRG